MTFDIEIALLLGPMKRTASIRAATPCLLYSLSRDGLNMILEGNEAIKLEMQAVAKERLEKESAGKVASQKRTDIEPEKSHVALKRREEWKLQSKRDSFPEKVVTVSKSIENKLREKSVSTVDTDKEDKNAKTKVKLEELYSDKQNSSLQTSLSVIAKNESLNIMPERSNKDLLAIPSGLNLIERVPSYKESSAGSTVPSLGVSSPLKIGTSNMVKVKLT